MVFSSFDFIVVFLPVALAGWMLTRSLPTDLRLGWILVCSMAFYAWWSIPYAVLLVVLTVVNYGLGRWIREGDRLRLGVAVAFNLTLLGYFKYTNFLIDNLRAVAHLGLSPIDVALPLGISFFTFQKIAFLVDCYRGKPSVRNVSLLRFFTFVWFFPQLIAGPIVHYSCLLPQFSHLKRLQRNDSLFIGLGLFAIGLFKKVVVADQLALGVQAYDVAVNFVGAQPPLVTAWLGALFYTFQIYFDFSGYSDMALGLARMFGIRLPANFWSPYRATSIVEFWRRWHMSLSQFLRDYLYISLGGNRRGPVRRYANLMLTMLIGGLWHGAAWTFVIWGALHGAYLAVNHAWRAINPRGFGTGRLGRAVGWLLTMASVVFAWSFFQAPSVRSALTSAGGMLGFNGICLPERLLAFLRAATGVDLTMLGIQPGPIFYGMEPYMSGLVAAMALALLCPNSLQIMARARPYWGRQLERGGWRGLAPSPSAAVAVGLLLLAGIAWISDGSPFIYYNF